MTRSQGLLSTVLFAVTAACASRPVLPVRDAGVNRVFATVRGVT